MSKRPKFRIGDKIVFDPKKIDDPYLYKIMQECANDFKTQFTITDTLGDDYAINMCDKFYELTRYPRPTYWAGVWWTLASAPEWPTYGPDYSFYDEDIEI